MAEFEEDLNTVEQEIERIYGYKKVFLRTHKYPEQENIRFIPPIPEYPEKLKPEELTFRHMMGLEATGFVVSTLGGTLFSAIRTIVIFVGTEIVILTTYGWPTAVILTIGLLAGVGILTGVEGYLMAYGLYEGKSLGKLDASPYGLYICIGISSLAGVISAFSLIAKDSWLQGVLPWVTGLLVLLSGLMSYVVYLGSKNIGVLYNRWKLEVDKKIADFSKLENKAKDDNLAMLKEAQDKHEKLVVQAKERFDAEVKKWEEEFEADYRQKGRDILFGAGRYTASRQRRIEPEAPQQPQQQEKQPTEKQRVADWLASKGISAFEVGTGRSYQPEMIAAETGILGVNVRNCLKRLRDDAGRTN